MWILGVGMLMLTVAVAASAAEGATVFRGATIHAVSGDVLSDGALLVAA
jgi:hypothetical protein